MLLNPISQNFQIWLPANFFYSDIVKLWKPMFKRLYLPYVTIEDMFNALISAISFPSVATSNVTQGNQAYKITKRSGFQLDQSMTKSFTLTIKLTESYMTYFIARQLFDLFLKWGAKYQNLYLPQINVTILDEGGFENITYSYYQITPESLSDFDLSFAARPGQFTTFTWGFNYNYFEIWYRDEDGNRKKMQLDTENGMVHDNGAPDVKNNPRALTKENSIEAFNKATNVKSMLK